ncbi:MAG: hypothetical protein QM756_22300 [Polyangiaceae bacterium]
MVSAGRSLWYTVAALSAFACADDHYRWATLPPAQCGVLTRDDVAVILPGSERTGSLLQEVNAWSLHCDWYTDAATLTLNLNGARTADAESALWKNAVALGADATSSPLSLGDSAAYFENAETDVHVLIVKRGPYVMDLSTHAFDPAPSQEQVVALAQLVLAELL